MYYYIHFELIYLLNLNTVYKCGTHNTDSKDSNHTDRLTVSPVRSCPLGVQDKSVCCGAMLNRQSQSPFLFDGRDMNSCTNDAADCTVFALLHRLSRSLSIE